MVQSFDYGESGKLPVPGTPIKMSATPGTIRTPSPRLGEHNQEIYGDRLGFSQEKLAKLKQDGTI